MYSVFRVVNKSKDDGQAGSYAENDPEFISLIDNLKTNGKQPRERVMALAVGETISLVGTVYGVPAEVQFSRLASSRPN